MQLTRYLKEDYIRVDLDDGLELDNEDGEPLSKRQLLELKEQVLKRMVELIDRSGRASNPTKLLHDLLNREKKATMAVGQGVVIPHVRTMQARDLAMALGISRRPLPWGDTPDREPVRIFVAIVAPPYEDRLYLQVYRRLGELFVREHAAEVILSAEHPGEIIRFLSSNGG
jgi:fructose-specific PTS system IIC-like component